MPDYKEFIDKEVQMLEKRFSDLLNKGNYRITEGNLEEIIFSNSKGNKLIFVYEPNRYIVGNFMLLSEIKFEQNFVVNTLGELAEKKATDFNAKIFFDSERKKNIPLRKTYVSLINNYLMEFLI